jgi:hypothetical protein
MDHPPQDSQNPYASPAIPSNAERPSRSPNKPNEPLVQPIRISGALSLEDYFRGARVGKRLQRRISIGVFAVGLLLIWGIYYAEIVQGNFTPVVIASAILLAAWSLTIIVLQWLINLRFRKACASGKGIFSHAEAVITEENYEVHQEAGDSKFRWSAFSRYRSTNHVTVLFFEGSPFQFGVIPRSRFQTQHDWECFLGLLDRKMPRC